MTLAETWDLTYWLFEKTGVQRLKLSTKPAHGDIKRGEGITAPALCNHHWPTTPINLFVMLYKTADKTRLFRPLKINHQLKTSTILPFFSAVNH